MRPEEGPPDTWEHELRGALDACWRAAARPASGPVPPTANVVLFADQAELLACLARDLVSGDAPLRWWWTALRRSLPAGALDALVAAWCRDAAAVPAALDFLVRVRAAEAVLLTLTPAEAVTVLRAIAAAFELPDLLKPPSGAGTTPQRHLEEVPVGAPSPATGRGLPPEVPPPWEPFVPAPVVPASLGVEHRALLGVALTLARAPLLARNTAYSIRLAAWWRAERARAAERPPLTSPPYMENRPRTAGASLEPEQPTRTTAGTARGATRRPGGDRAGPDHAPPEAAPAFPARAPDDRVAPPPPRKTRHSSPLPKRKPKSSTPRPSTRAATPRPEAPLQQSRRVPPPMARGVPGVIPHGAIDRATEQLRLLGLSKGAPSEAQLIAPPPAFAPDEISWTATQLGGVFFLVTLLIRLDFFGALERDFHVSTTIGGWGWIDLVSRALLDRHLARHAGDAVWRCLAVLDERDPDTYPGGEFRGASPYRLPAAWDVPTVLRLPPVRLARGAWSRRLPAAVRQFLETILPFLRWRLSRALGLEHERDLPAALLEVPAKVFVSSTHVDVRFPLTAARYAVRVTGLDANPGWVPALGRVVAFEFA